MHRSIWLSLILATFIGPAMAQAPGASLVSVTAAAPKSVARGQHGQITLVLTIKPGYHINASKPADPSLIATRIAPTTISGLSFGAARFPPPQSIHVSYSSQPLLVYRGRTTVTVPFTVAKTMRPGRTKVTGSILYQACNAQSCYPPRSASYSDYVSVK